jgi:hypothetical protein
MLRPPILGQSSSERSSSRGDFVTSSVNPLLVTSWHDVRLRIFRDTDLRTWVRLGGSKNIYAIEKLEEEIYGLKGC